MNWQLHSLSGGLGSWADRWDGLNRQLYGSHPLFDSRFVSALLKHFGTGQEYLAAHGPEHAPDGMMILVPHRIGMHRTFLPAQAQVCPVLVRSPDLLEETFASLKRSVMAVDWLCQDPMYSPIANSDDRMWTRSVTHAVTMNIALDGEFDAYWAARSKKLRNNSRRYLRRLEQEGLEERVTMIDEPGQVAEAVRRYGELEATGWKARAGTAVTIDNAQGRFYTDVLRAFTETGQAAIYEYAAGDSVIASRMVVWNNDIMVMLKTAYDESFARFAPGRRLLYRLLQREFEYSQGKSLEFYTNASRDQLSWATGTREIRHVTGYRNRMACRAHAFLGRLKGLLHRRAVP